jgi:arginine-tRNA-protein transferase
MIYSFYDPEHEARTGLGNYIILDHIKRATEGKLPYVYLGYWVEGSQRMQYKVRYRPLERLGPDGWRRFSEEQQATLIAAAAEQRGAVPGVDGGTKDGTPGGQQQYKIA